MVGDRSTARHAGGSDWHPRVRAAARRRPARVQARHGGDAETGEIRIVEVIAHDYEGFGRGGLVEDLKLGFGALFQHHSAFRRVAVVSDKEWVAHTLHALAWMVPGELAIFGLDELGARRSGPPADAVP